MGDANITHEAGPEYVTGARWNDSVDGNGSVDANGTVNYLVPGIYQITYTYTDSSGNPAVPVIRLIKVEDNTPPVITLIGDTNITHPASTTYIDQSEVERYCGWQYRRCQWFGRFQHTRYLSNPYSATDTAGNVAYKLLEPSG